MNKEKIRTVRKLIRLAEEEFENTDGYDIDIDRKGNDVIIGVDHMHKSKKANKKALFEELDILVSQLDDCEKTIEIDNGDKIVKYLFTSENDTKL